MKQKNIIGENKMRNEYDFSNSVNNPYIKKLKKQITIRLENETIEYFKELATETDIPYQKLINIFLSDCAKQQMKPSISWSK